jgi:hypothetical protein
MDSNCDIFEITAKNYLVLTQNAYEIKPFDFFGKVDTESSNEEVLVSEEEKEEEEDPDTHFIIEGDINQTI